jgi:OOP family OmpA-OmpF porin
MTPKLVILSAILMVMPLGACTSESGEPGTPETPTNVYEAPTPEAEQTEPVSILRPGVEAETAESEDTPLEDYSVTIGFPLGGSDLDAEALAVLEQVQATEQFALTGAIIIRAHSDSAGSDEANERASEARGLAVAEWLIAAGAEPRRIDVIVFGEQNPAEPNALPDGSPNDTGRASNRRVELEILAPPSDAPEGAELEGSDEG